MPTISVIIPHYEDLARLDLCLGDLERQTLPQASFEIVVADNASPIGEAAIQAVVKDRARLVVCPERGAGPARNAGVAVSTGQILAFTDADCRPAPEWLAEAVDALGDFDLVGGRMRVLVESQTRPTATECFEAVFAFDNETYVRKKGFSVTANLACRRPVFEAVGGFATEVSEDLDWSHRARDAGFRLGYAGRAVVGHPARRTWDELLRKWTRLNAEAFAIARARKGGRWAWLAKTLGLPVSALVHTPKVVLSPALETWGQKTGALVVLYRLRAWRFVDSLRLLAAARGH